MLVRCTTEGVVTHTGPTISATCDTVVPADAPRYNTFEPGAICNSSTPPNIPAANFDLKGFHTLYSIFVPSGPSTEILFSPYVDSPGTRFFVTSKSSFPRAMNTP